MRFVPVDKLIPGAIVEQNLLDAEGNVILYKGVRLSMAYIKGIKARGHTRLYVKDPGETDVERERDLSNETRIRAKETLAAAFDRIADALPAVRKATTEDIAKALSTTHVRVLLTERGPLAQVAEIANRIVEEVLTQDSLAGVTCIKTGNTPLYDHCLDVCVVAIMIGRIIELPPERLGQLATGCLLHDIGMLFVGPELDELERIRQHTVLGYELLRSTDDPDILSPHVAYEHHEHQDGTGLPRSLAGSNTVERGHRGSTSVLTLIAEIAAIANCYDNLLSGAHRRPPMAPDQALAEISRRAGTRLNAEIVAAFRSVAPVYPKGAQVMLEGQTHDKCLAVVSEVHPDQLARPTVILVRDPAGERIDPVKVDCREHPTIKLRTVGL